MRKIILLSVLLAGCFTYQVSKYLVDSQALYRDVCSLTDGKINGQPFSESPYGAIAADEAVLEVDYAQNNPLSLNQLHTLESSIAIYKYRDSIGASKEFFVSNGPSLDSTAWQIYLGEYKKNSK